MILVSELQSKFTDLITSISGDVKKNFSEVASFDKAQSDSLIFIHNEKALASATTSKASIIVISDKLKEKINIDANKVYIFAKKSDVLISQILQTYFNIPANSSIRGGVHTSVVLGDNVSIDHSAQIGPNVVIQNNVTIKKGVSIGPNTYIASNTLIGENSHIDANNYIGPNTIIKSHVRVLSQNTLGSEPYCYDAKGALLSAKAGVTLEDRVEIGVGNVIERGLTNQTVIQTGAKLDNRIFIGSESSIGPHSFLTAGLRISHNVTTGHHFVCGGGTHIEPNTKICDMVQVAGISCVTKDITKPGAYGGFPLQPMRDYLRTSMAMTKIPELRRDIAKLLNENEA